MNTAKFMSLWVIIFGAMIIVSCMVTPCDYQKWPGLIFFNALVSLIGSGIYSIVDYYN